MKTQEFLIIPSAWFTFKLVRVLLCYIYCALSIFFEFCCNCHDAWAKIVNERNAKAKRKLKESEEQEEDSEINHTQKKQTKKYIEKEESTDEKKKEKEEPKIKMNTRNPKAGVCPCCDKHYRNLPVHLPSCCAKLKKNQQ